MSYDPALAGQPAIPFSTKVRDMCPIRPILTFRLYPIGNGLFQPIIYFGELFFFQFVFLLDVYHFLYAVTYFYIFLLFSS